MNISCVKIAYSRQVNWLQQQVAKRRVKRDIEFNDPQWPKEWYLVSKTKRESGVLIRFTARPQDSLCCGHGFNQRPLVSTLRQRHH